VNKKQSIGSTYCFYSSQNTEIMRFLFFLFLLTAWMVADAQSVFNSSIDHLAETYVGKKKNHALVIGIFQDGQLEIKGYGQLSEKDPAVPDGTTAFEIGSLSSVFTTSLMLVEEEHGHFFPEDRVQDYFPEDIDIPEYHPFICQEVEELPYSGVEGSTPTVQVVCIPNPNAPTVCMGFCDLASHTSGLPDHPGGKTIWDPIEAKEFSQTAFYDFSPKALYESLHRVETNDLPGQRYQYSGAGIALLGNVLANINKTSYQQLLDKQLLQPLQLTKTQLLLQAADTEGLAPAHSATGKPVDHMTYQAMAPAFGIRSTAEDLLRFTALNLETGEDLWPTIFEQAHQPRLDLAEGKFGQPTSVGYGWFSTLLSEKSNQPVIWQNGAAPGYRAFIGMVKDKQTGIVILSNSANSVDEIGFGALQLLIN
jgi:CubicO group peptidase (beta-lactamase class C family)